MLLADGRAELSDEIRRQSLICSLFGVRHIVLAVRGLDCIGFAEAAFEQLVADYRRFAGELGFASLAAIPLSPQTPWYRGPTLLDHLEGIPASEAPADQPAPVPTELADQFAAHLVWLKEAALVPGRAYWLAIGAHKVSATVTALKHRVDVGSGAHVATRTLGHDEIGYCNLATGAPIAFDTYARSHDTGSFILIDRQTQEIAAAGAIDFALRRATNVHWHQSTISPGQRAELKGHGV